MKWMTTRQIKTCSRRGKEYKFRVICNQMSYQNQIFILVAIFFFFFLRSFISLLHYWYLVDEKWLHVYPFFGWSKINRRKLFSFLFPYFPPPLYSQIESVVKHSKFGFSTLNIMTK